MLTRAIIVAAWMGAAGLPGWVMYARGADTPEAQQSDVTFDGKTYTNRLAASHDPYLLSHAHNPVDWYPWGPEALAKARRENKPIFLSVGYSTCYWCYVAARQIYSNPQIAKLMNQWFVNIKVDREERPDIDRVYMRATRIMAGGGGWPNNVFLTPDLKPFYAGSYFSPKDRSEQPGFPRILTALHDAWSHDRAKLVATSERVYQALQQSEDGAGVSVPPAPRAWLLQAVQEAAGNFDELSGGFGSGATKFPQSPLVSMLLAAYEEGPGDKARDMATQTLQAMAEGGVMDQLAGGFHRYSTEPSWSIPHFEKMLYDNAQLLGLYARAYTVTGNSFFRQVALRTAHYLSSQMRAPSGGFYSAQDAEVDGIEGASYVWTAAQTESLLGRAGADRFFALYALTPMPDNTAGQRQSAGGVLRLSPANAQELADHNALAATIDALAPLRERLLAARDGRPQPARDEKIIVADNALAIIGFAEAGEALHDAALTRTAIECADWVVAHAFEPRTGLLQHQLFRGHAGGEGFLDDYALLGRALLALYRVTGDVGWESRARQVTEAMLKRFAHADGALATTWDVAGLPIAPPSDGDSAKPSGRSSAVALLLEMAAATGDQRYAAGAQRALAPLSARIARRPSDWSALVSTLSRPSLVAILDRSAKVEEREASARTPESADYVRARGELLVAKEGTVLTVTVQVEPGFHINANPASESSLIATQLTVEDAQLGKVQYPPEQRFKAPFAPQGIAVYQGRIELRARLARLARRPPSVHLRVQACNDQYCLAPSTLTVPVR